MSLRTLYRRTVARVPGVRPAVAHLRWYYHFNYVSYALARATGRSYREWYATILDAYADSAPAPLVDVDAEMGRAQLDFLRSHGLTPRHRVLDLGCGNLRAGVYLIDFLDAGHYTGADISDGRLAQGRQRIEERGLAAKRPSLVRLTRLDFEELAGSTFDYVWAQGVLAHMPVADIEAMLGHVRRIMHEGSVFLANYSDGRADSYQASMKDFYYSRATMDAVCARSGLVHEEVRDWRAGTPLPLGETDRMLRMRLAPAAHTQGSAPPMREFVTSFGTRIPLVEGYRDAHPRLRITDITTPYADTVPTHLGFDGFVRDVYEYAVMMDFLTNLGARTRWTRALDLGGAEGTMSRLLRAEGRADHAVTLDASDVSRTLTTGRLLKHWARFRAAAFASRFSPRLRRFLLGEDVWRSRRLSPVYNHWGYRPPASSTFWRPRLRRLPALDEYIVGDVYDHHARYDLVTAFFCLDYFDLEKAFAKLTTLLEDGGTLFLAVNYWWYPANSTMLVGDFPYCAQRLTREDFQRYLREFRPDEEADALARYDYFHCGVMHPTLDDYVALGDRNGLTLIGSQRLAPPRDIHHRAAVAPRLLNEFPDTRLADVLADIHKFRPDVGLVDLQTAHIMVAFEKRPARREPLAAYLKSEAWPASVRDLERRVLLDPAIGRAPR